MATQLCTRIGAAASLALESRLWQSRNWDCDGVVTGIVVSHNAGQVWCVFPYRDRDIRSQCPPTAWNFRSAHSGSCGV